MGRYRQPDREPPVTGTIASIRAQLGAGCTVSRCRRDGCSVSLAKAPERERRLIVDLDKPGAPLRQADRRCDYLFFAEPACCQLWIAPVELMKGYGDASKAIEQLQAGASEAENLVSERVGSEALFRPVLASGGMRKAETRKLRAGRIKFHGQQESVRRIANGSPLMNVLKR